jgi:CHAT domain
MRFFLSKHSPPNKLGEVLVKVSETDDPPVWIDSHSFVYTVHSDGGDIVIYTAAGDLQERCSFDPEKCRNKSTNKKHEPCNERGCPFIGGKPGRLLVADIFHTKPSSNSLYDFGTALFKCLFSGISGNILNNIERSSGRIFLELNGDDELEAIPWEYARNVSGYLVRQYKFARLCCKTRDSPLPKCPLRIAAAVPDPIVCLNEDLPDLHLSDQFRNFSQEFNRIQKAVELKLASPPTIEQTCFLLTNATAFHFMGHCKEKGDTRALVFAKDKDGTPDCVASSRLIVAPDKPRLAFLCACNTREIAQCLAAGGIPYNIGSNYAIPDDLARKFELLIYKFLAGGSSVEEAMHRARVHFDIQDDERQRDYFAGAMVLYLSTIREEDGIFECGDGTPKVVDCIPPNNLLSELHHAPNMPRYNECLSKSYVDLKGMVERSEQTQLDMYIVKGTSRQDRTNFVVEIMKRTTHLFPGGVFAWSFDRHKTSVVDYLRRLVEVIFGKEALLRLNHTDVQELESAIMDEFKAGTHTTYLLILNQADILGIGKQQGNKNAEELVRWFQQVVKSRRVKILVTSSRRLKWCAGADNDSIDLGIVEENEFGGVRDNIHEHFGKYYLSAISFHLWITLLIIFCFLIISHYF